MWYRSWGQVMNVWDTAWQVVVESRVRNLPYTHEAPRPDCSSIPNTTRGFRPRRVSGRSRASVESSDRGTIDAEYHLFRTSCP